MKTIGTKARLAFQENTTAFNAIRRRKKEEEAKKNKKNYKCHCRQGVKSHLSRKGLCADSAHQSTYGRADLTTLIL